MIQKNITPIKAIKMFSIEVSLFSETNGNVYLEYADWSNEFKFMWLSVLEPLFPEI